MFWKKKKKCPIKLEDKNWVEEKLDWINTNFIDISRQPTILPTRKYFKSEFKGDEEDAYLVLDVISDYFQINSSRIKLGFYTERSEDQDVENGTYTKQEGSGSAGLYIQDIDGCSIMIEMEQLKRPISLIATMAHELSHYLIMEEKGYYFDEYENEILTDLTAIAYGFGIFLGNSKFKFNQWQSGDGWGGWSSSTQGYLPQQVIAYVMAEIERRKGSYSAPWINFLEGSFQKDFEKSIKYLEFTDQPK